jgi:hypothetical protein
MSDKCLWKDIGIARVPDVSAVSPGNHISSRLGACEGDVPAIDLYFRIATADKAKRNKPQQEPARNVTPSNEFVQQER